MNIIEVKNLNNGFAPDKLIHYGLNLQVKKDEIHALIGGSGSGKSVLLKVLLGLKRPYSGEVSLLGLNPFSEDSKEQAKLRSETSVLFQEGALFSSLTVFENLVVPIQRWQQKSDKWIKAHIMDMLHQVGLSTDVGSLYPSELSGGMKKRVALARALTLKPKLIFLDEPTAGLDPISASAFDELVLRLREKFGLTFFMITHDLDTLYHIADKISVLCNKKIETGTFKYFQQGHHDPWVQNYFCGPRAARFRA